MQKEELTHVENPPSLSRRSLLIGLTAAVASPALAAAAPGPVADATMRRFWMTSIHTREHIDVVYYRNGEYDATALKQIHHFLRDWRTGDIYQMDLTAINLWSDLHHALGSQHPFQLISGYRSPKTNDHLRTSSTGVAKKSLHQRGMAADLRLQDRSLRQIAKTARAIGAGGIGLYSRSNFIHIDTGRARSWGS